MSREARMVQTLVVVAHADGRVGRRQRRLIEQFAGDWGVGSDAVLAAEDAYEAGERKVEVPKHEDDRRRLFKAMVKVAAVTGEVTAKERNLLETVGGRLGWTSEQVGAEIVRVLSKRRVRPDGGGRRSQAQRAEELPEAKLLEVRTRDAPQTRRKTMPVEEHEVRKGGALREAEREVAALDEADLAAASFDDSLDGGGRESAGGLGASGGDLFGDSFEGEGGDPYEEGEDEAGGFVLEEDDAFVPGMSKGSYEGEEIFDDSREEVFGDPGYRTSGSVDGPYRGEEIFDDSQEELFASVETEDVEPPPLDSRDYRDSLDDLYDEGQVDDPAAFSGGFGLSGSGVVEVGVPDPSEQSIVESIPAPSGSRSELRESGFRDSVLGDELLGDELLGDSVLGDSVLGDSVLGASGVEAVPAPSGLGVSATEVGMPKALQGRASSLEELPPPLGEVPREELGAVLSRHRVQPTEVAVLGLVLLGAAGAVWFGVPGAVWVRGAGVVVVGIPLLRRLWRELRWGVDVHEGGLWLAPEGWAVPWSQIDSVQVIERRQTMGDVEVGVLEEVGVATAQGAYRYLGRRITGYQEAVEVVRARTAPVLESRRSQRLRRTQLGFGVVRVTPEVVVIKEREVPRARIGGVAGGLGEVVLVASDGWQPLARLPNGWVEDRAGFVAALEEGLAGRPEGARAAARRRRWGFALYAQLVVAWAAIGAGWLPLQRFVPAEWPAGVGPAALGVGGVLVFNVALWIARRVVDTRGL